MRLNKAGQGLCAIALVASLFGCGSGTGSEERGATQGDTPSPRAVRALGKDQVQAVLPDLGDVPPGWEKAGTMRLQGPDPEDGGSLAHGTQGYVATDLDGDVGFGIRTFKTRAQAIARYSESKSRMGSARVGPAQIPDVDAGFTASYCIGKHYCSTSITLRLDSVHAWVNINTDGPPAADVRILHPVTRMFVQRIRQALDGQSPSAKAP